jgi:hypothetical protein
MIKLPKLVEEKVLFYINYHNWRKSINDVNNEYKNSVCINMDHNEKETLYFRVYSESRLVYYWVSIHKLSGEYSTSFQGINRPKCFIAKFNVNGSSLKLVPKKYHYSSGYSGKIPLSALSELQI